MILLEAATGRLYRVLGVAVGLIIGAIALAIVLDLGARKLGVPFIGGMQELVEYALFISVFLGAPWVLRENAHIRVDFVSAFMGPAGRRRMGIIVNVIGLTVCLILVYYGWRNLADAYAFKFAQRQYYVVMEWMLLTVFVTSLTLCAFEFALRLYRRHPEFGSEAS